VEVSSSASLDPAHALPEEQERKLIDLGWQPPEGHAGAPNFYRVSLEPPEANSAAQLTITTLEQVFDVQPDEALLVKVCESRSVGTNVIE
jgi:hypothetical protein